MSKPPYSDGRVHVMADKCSTCVFRPGNLMRLQPGRVKEMVDGSLADQSAITCHKTLYGQAEQESVCRGFFDAYGHKVQALDLAEKIGIIEFTTPG